MPIEYTKMDLASNSFDTLFQNYVRALDLEFQTRMDAIREASATEFDGAIKASILKLHCMIENSPDPTALQAIQVLTNLIRECK